ncbi:MAG: DUF512 domain-containing protein [Clostridia bacterium]|nr:DUF512 domain-containing protein [Clostridia bacterium]
MVRISSVEKHSAAEKAGILGGDLLCTVNGQNVVDVLDYRFLITEERVTLSLLRGERSFVVTIDKEEYADIGLEFETYLMDKERSCENNCIFCFIDQNPRGMRETIYFKDDDTRLSFLHGNYVTLTNCDHAELERIARLRLSPVNVSVHTTNPTLRVQMLGHPNAGEIMGQLRFLVSRQIRINCQIVLCRGINDGEELLRTLKDLVSLGEMVESVAVVPAGLTRFRKGLADLTDFDAESAAEVIDLVEAFADKQYEKYGSRRVFLADEFYIRASRTLPEAEVYEGYPQLDNGVGLLRSMEEDVLFALPDAPKPAKRRRYLAFTGKAAYAFVSDLVARVLKGQDQVECTVKAVKNFFYGESVTVAGLLTGSDYQKAAKEADLKEYDAVLIPASSLRYERDLFLDGVALADLEKEWNLPVIPVEGGEDIVYKLLGEN